MPKSPCSCRKLSVRRCRLLISRKPSPTGVPTTIASETLISNQILERPETEWELEIDPIGVRPSSRNVQVPAARPAHPDLRPAGSVPISDHRRISRHAVRIDRIRPIERVAVVGVEIPLPVTINAHLRDTGASPVAHHRSIPGGSERE